MTWASGWVRVFVAGVVLACGARAVAAQPGEGVRVGASADGAFVLRLGGDVQLDARAFPSGRTEPDAVFFIRRARLDVRGRLYDRFRLRLRTNVAGSRLVLQDAVLRVRLAPRLGLQMGSFKAPVGLERLQSAHALVLPERAFVTDVLPNRDVGVQLDAAAWNERLAVAAGVFEGVTAGTTRGGTDGRVEGAARVFAEPLPPAWGARLGLGVAATWGHARGTPEAPGLPRLGTAGGQPFYRPSDGVVLHGLRRRLTPQGYLYAGPVGLMAAWARTTEATRRADGRSADVATTAWHVTAHVVLTGEAATFAPLRPARPFAAAPGPGAWTLALRLHDLRADAEAFPTFADPAVSMRAARAWAVGLVWQANAFVRAHLAFEQTTFAAAEGAAARPTERLVRGRLSLAF